jgi:hypothetical protein
LENGTGRETQGNAAYHARTKHPVTPTLKLACPIPSFTEMVKTAAQLKDHYTNSHTDCMIEYEVEKIMAHRNKKGRPMRQTDGIPHQMARV